MRPHTRIMPPIAAACAPEGPCSWSWPKPTLPGTSTAIRVKTRPSHNKIFARIFIRVSSSRILILKLWAADGDEYALVKRHKRNKYERSFCISATYLRTVVESAEDVNAVLSFRLSQQELGPS